VVSSPIPTQTNTSKLKRAHGKKFVNRKDLHSAFFGEDRPDLFVGSLSVKFQFPLAVKQNIVLRKCLVVN
jgi:hypothetical protein